MDKELCKCFVNGLNTKPTCRAKAAMLQLHRKLKMSKEELLLVLVHYSYYHRQHRVFESQLVVLLFLDQFFHKTTLGRLKL